MEFEMGFDVDRRVKADRPPKDKPGGRAGNAGQDAGLQTEMLKSLELFEILHDGERYPCTIAQVRNT